MKWFWILKETKRNRNDGITVQIREETLVDESGSFGAAVAVVDADVGGVGGGEDLALILETVIGLGDGDGEVAGGVGLQVGVPEESVGTAASEAAIQRAVAQTQHDLTQSVCVEIRIYLNDDDDDDKVEFVWEVRLGLASEEE